MKAMSKIYLAIIKENIEYAMRAEIDLDTSIDKEIINKIVELHSLLSSVKELEK